MQCVGPSVKHLTQPTTFHRGLLMQKVLQV